MATAAHTSTSPTPATRKGFALTGPSRQLDPRTNAVRPDIADVRVAERVFAPHYAAPLRRVLAADATLRVARDVTSEPVAQLARGDAFDLLDVTGGDAWGIALASGLVGYVDASVLAPA